MPETDFFSRFYALCRQNGTSPNAVGREIGASSGSITAWKQGTLPRAGMIQKIAAYFDVPVNFLLEGDENDHSSFVSDAQLKFALFGGDKEITDEMLDEVRQFAEFIKYRK